MLSALMNQQMEIQALKEEVNALKKDQDLSET
jgi:hypothetical protein